MNILFAFCFLFFVQMAFSQSEELVRISDLSELDMEATKIQFRNHETQQYIVWRKPYLNVHAFPDQKGWRFSGYDQQQLRAIRVNVHTPSAPSLDWSNFPTRHEERSFMALTPAKKGEAVPFQWEIRASKTKGCFLLYHCSTKECVYIPYRSSHLATHKVEEYNPRQDWEIWTDKKRLVPTKRDAVKDFSTDTSFHKGWSYGYLDSATATVFHPYTSPAKEQWGQGGWALPDEKTGIYCIKIESSHFFLEELYFIAQSTLFYYLDDTTTRLPVLQYTIPKDGAYVIRFDVFSPGKDVTPRIIVQEGRRPPSPIAPPLPIDERRNRKHMLSLARTFRRGDVLLYYVHSMDKKEKLIEVQATVRPLPDTD